MGLLSVFSGEAKGKRRLALRERQRAYFRVTDPKIKRDLTRWAERYREASFAIADYLKTVAGVLGATVPNYKLDEDGYVKSIQFLDAVPLTHDGWRGDGTNWLFPESDRVKQELRQLPPLPKISEINTLIGWPEAVIDEYFRDMHLPGYYDFAMRANHQTHVFTGQGEVFISVPYPDTFSDYPDLAARIQDWRQPDFMEVIDNTSPHGALARDIEKRYKKAQSPLGRFLEKIGYSLAP